MAHEEPSSLAELISSEGLVGDEPLRLAIAEAKRSGTSLIRALVNMGAAEEEALLQAAARHHEIEFIRKLPASVDQKLTKTIPARFVTHYKFIPISQQNGVIRAVFCDVPDTHTLDELRLVLRNRVEPLLTTSAEVTAATNRLYGLGADTVERMISQGNGDRAVAVEERPEEDVGDQTIDASIIRFVNQIFSEAIQSNATDIHVEPFEDELRVRYRIDGVLHEVPVPGNVRGFHSSIVSRVKIMSDLNIAERRLPQDGRIKIRLSGQEYDLRVSILPTPYGETICIRILSRTSMFLGFEKLGLAERNQKLLEKMIRKPHGIILVTGPTGSGKTTTLYACLHRLNSPDKKIITVENPVEYQLKGISQMQVVPKIGFTFAAGLRHMLRHDPDVMMVGEIRDYETAEVAIRSALTGHLVFSTLHTNDSTGAITRLVDMGVEPFLVTSTVISSVAQRLVRRICPDCREPYHPDDDLMLDMGVDPSEKHKHTFYRGRGCELCKGTGYRGRIAIYELMPMRSEVKSLVLERAPTHKIREKTIALGMTTLKQDGWLRVCEGITTFEEVLRVAQEDDSFD